MDRILLIMTIRTIIRILCKAFVTFFTLSYQNSLFPDVDTTGGSVNSRILELMAASGVLNKICVFTVVPDVLLALENSKYTRYNIIMMKSSSMMNHKAFFRTLRQSGETAQGVAVISNDEEFDSTILKEKHLNIVATLKDPVSTEDLCEVINHILD